MKLTLIFAILMALPAAAQQDKEAIKKKLMDQVKARLEKERAAVLDRVGKLIDEELAKTAGGGPIGDQIEARLRELELTVAEAQAEAREWALWKTDLKMIEELQANPLNDADIKQLWDEGFAALSEDHDFEKGNANFKKIYYFLKISGSNHDYVMIAPYNLACGYSLWGKEHQQEALDWLEISLRNDYTKRASGCQAGRCQYDPEPHNSFEHMEIDPDLENLRDSDRWKDLVRRFKP